MKRTKLFTGHKYLRVERYPEYVCSHCNSFYLFTLINFFGLIRLVVRIKATGYTEEAIALAKKCFPILSPLCRGNYLIPEDDELETPEGVMQYLYCYNKNGVHIGVLHELWDLLQYDCEIDEEYHGVMFSKKLDGYIGFSHRAYEVFRIGDKLFDEHWRPDGSEIHFKRGMNTMEDILDDIPFVLRGSTICITQEDCRQAAINFSKYVS